MEGISIVLESESLVLVMDEAFPTPYWNANFLPQLYLVVFLSLFEILFKLWNGQVLDGLEVISFLNILFICQGVLNVLDSIIPI